MIIRIKLYAALGKYLPEGAVKNEADMEEDVEESPSSGSSSSSSSSSHSDSS